MFGINESKLMEKVNEVILPKMLLQEPEDLVKYNLALKYLMDMSDFKMLGCTLATVLGTTAFFCLESTVPVALGATAAIAAAIKTVKLNSKKKEYRKAFALIITGLKIIHLLTDEDLDGILDKITSDDFISFLEKQELTEKEEV